MSAPILVDVIRGQTVESRHRGAFVVTDAKGQVVAGLGDGAGRVFPRSAIKAIQALPLVESGAADALRLTDAQIALACASHNGEGEHVAGAAAMLSTVGRDVAALECGAHWPGHQPALIALAASGATPTALHNNCSGKHAGFVCTAVHQGIDPTGYVEIGHPIQRAIRAVMEDVTGATLVDDVCGTDGCSIPTFGVPLTALGHGFARMATGEGLSPARAAAAARILKACMAHPFMVAGSERFDTQIMAAFPGRVFVKIGAEGVFCGALPEVGLGFALKIEDGASRAAEVACAAIVAAFLPAGSNDTVTLDRLTRPVMKNWNARMVGNLRPTEALLAALRG